MDVRASAVNFFCFLVDGQQVAACILHIVGEFDEHVFQQRLRVLVEMAVQVASLIASLAPVVQCVADGVGLTD